MAVYPTPEFPGKTQEDLLGLLLRKKLEPDVEDWVEEGHKTAVEALDGGNTGGLREEDMHDLWEWAGMAANEQARKHTWGGNYTLEEREMGVENVVTGLRRKLKVDPDDSSDDDDDGVEDDDNDNENDPDKDELELVRMHRKENDDGVEFDLSKESQRSAALPMNDIFRFMMTGNAPRG